MSDTDPKTPKRVSADDLRDFIARALVSLGLP